MQPYSHLKKEELWKYLNEIKRDVYRETKKHCPSVLEDIIRKNREQKNLHE